MRDGYRGGPLPDEMPPPPATPGPTARRAFSKAAGTKLGEITSISEDAGSLVVNLLLNDEGLRLLRDSQYGVWDDDEDD